MNFACDALRNLAVIEANWNQKHLIEGNMLGAAVSSAFIWLIVSLWTGPAVVRAALNISPPPFVLQKARAQ